VHKLPVVFLCENNGWAISVPLDQQMAITTMEARAAAYGFAGASVDGCDAEAVHEAAATAITRARNNEGPTLIDMSVPRIVPHSSQDDDAYRDADEKAAAAARDRSLACAPGSSSCTHSIPKTTRSRKSIEADVLAAAELAIGAPEPRPIERASTCTPMGELLASSGSSKRSAKRSTRRWLATTTSCCSART
jgi:TPP-dependent pyruvate/acetoin dehydrogenase alpha subunit